MFCNNCGKPIADEDVFCRFCGANLSTNEIIQSPVAPAPAPAPAATPVQPDPSAAATQFNVLITCDSHSVWSYVNVAIPDARYKTAIKAGNAVQLRLPPGIYKCVFKCVKGGVTLDGTHKYVKQVLITDPNKLTRIMVNIGRAQNQIDII